jgi:hypothetical protein
MDLTGLLAYEFLPGFMLSQMSEFLRTLKRFISKLGLYYVSVKRQHNIRYIITKFGL